MPATPPVGRGWDEIGPLVLAARRLPHTPTKPPIPARTSLSVQGPQSPAQHEPPENGCDNVAMERFRSALKNELIHSGAFTKRVEAFSAIFEYEEVFRECSHFPDNLTTRRKHSAAAGDFRSRFQFCVQLPPSRFGATLGDGIIRSARIHETDACQRTCRPISRGRLGASDFSVPQQPHLTGLGTSTA